MNVFIKLDKLKNLTESEERLANYMLDNTEEFVKSSALDVFCFNFYYL
ncbi:hypothetical protein [Clostridium intestinale]|nr:hypothetical protein [Clostridium intestinale]